MIKVDVQNLSTEFTRQAREFIDSPSLMKGLGLDDVSMKLMQVANSMLKDPDLMGALHRFRQACRDQNVAQLTPLFEEIRNGLRSHRLDV